MFTRSTRTLAIAVRPPSQSGAPDVDIVIPVHNEEDDLARSVTRLHAYLSATFPWTYRITIVDNASTDATWAIARGLADDLDHVRTLHLDRKGRGRALKTAWSTSDATVVAYMDVDLSTDLAALQPLVAPLLSGHSDIAIGTRLARGARVVRGPRRDVISRCYNLLLRATLRARFSDAQCGFKAVRADRARELLPLVEDTGWFFDTELLVLGERAGLRIHEVPVDWTDDPDSRVDIVTTAVEDLRGVARLARGLLTGRISLAEVSGRLRTGAEPLSLFTQIVRFAAVGIVSTLAHLLVFLALRPLVSAAFANAVGLIVTTIGNTAANRRFTFGRAGTPGVLRHQLQGLVVFGVALGLTSGALVLAHALSPDAGTAVEAAVVVVANLGATALRFVLLRTWVFGARSSIRTEESSCTR